jgi:hypothetical protein
MLQDMFEIQIEECFEEYVCGEWAAEVFGE